MKSNKFDFMSLMNDGIGVKRCTLRSCSFMGENAIDEERIIKTLEWMASTLMTLKFLRCDFIDLARLSGTV